MRQVKSEQRLRSHPCLVETLEVTGKDAPASVELYTLGRQAKFHVIVQQLCEVSPCRGQYIVQPHTLCACAWHAQGGDLFQYILTLQPFSEPLAKHFFAQLIEGISAMHERSHFHGDLKMENLMISKDQETGEYSLRVGDFGLMRVHQGAASAFDSNEDQVHVLRARSSGTVSRSRLLQCPPTSLGRRSCGSCGLCRYVRCASAATRAAENRASAERPPDTDLRPFRSHDGSCCC